MYKTMQNVSIEQNNNKNNINILQQTVKELQNELKNMDFNADDYIYEHDLFEPVASNVALLPSTSYRVKKAITHLHRYIICDNLYKDNVGRLIRLYDAQTKQYNLVSDSGTSDPFAVFKNDKYDINIFIRYNQDNTFRILSIDPANITSTDEIPVILTNVNFNTNVTADNIYYDNNIMLINYDNLIMDKYLLLSQHNNQCVAYLKYENNTYTLNKIVIYNSIPAYFRVPSGYVLSHSVYDNFTTNDGKILMKMVFKNSAQESEKYTIIFNMSKVFENIDKTTGEINISVFSEDSIFDIFGGDEYPLLIDNKYNFIGVYKDYARNWFKNENKTIISNYFISDKLTSTNYIIYSYSCNPSLIIFGDTSGNAFIIVSDSIDTIKLYASDYVNTYITPDIKIINGNNNNYFVLKKTGDKTFNITRFRPSARTLYSNGINTIKITKSNNPP